MSAKDLEQSLKEAASKYDNVEFSSAEYDEERGVATVKVSMKGGPTLPDLPPSVEVESGVLSDVLGSCTPIYNDSASMRRIDLDPLSRNDLDLVRHPSIPNSSPQDLYQRSIDYYRTKDVYGTVVNMLTNFASKGFENDIDDHNLKNFYDSWVLDTGFDDFVDKIFFDFFRVGMVRTYKIRGKYEPKINFLSPSAGKKPGKLKEKAIRNNRFSNSFIPIAYTILNPTMVEIKGSLMFGQTATFLKSAAGQEIRLLLEMKKENLSTFQKKILANLPADFKKAVLAKEDIPLDPDLIGEVDYRRMPYERYPVPRGSRAFDALVFKDELRKADYSTLDGITNYILKITVGTDQHPVTKQETLERVAEMFDTVSKSFKVVWGHTLNVEKITSPEVGEILGQDKYKQVNEDITAALGVPRVLIDGLGDSSSAAVKVAIKSVIEEINYARRQVKRWIYGEYRAVAEAMGFSRIPKVRFDDMALRDEIQMMTILQGLIDRRIISYNTGQKKLGYDPETEISQMKEEMPLVTEGILGLRGSPFQQSGTQNVQGTPKGTPSEGRPKGRPAPTPAPKDETVPDKVKAEELEIIEVFEKFSVEQIESLLEMVKGQKESE